MPELLHDLSWVLPLRHDWLTTLMHGFSYLGYEKFILFFLPLGYWAWNKAIFLRLFLLVAFTAVLNAGLGNRLLDMPLALPPVTLNLYWSVQAEAEPGNRWLRQQVLALAASQHG